MVMMIWRKLEFFLTNMLFFVSFQLNNTNIQSSYYHGIVKNILCRCEEMFARLLREGGWDVAIIFHSVFWCFSTNCEQPVRLPRLLRGIKITCNIFAIFLHNEYYLNFLNFGFQIKIGAPHIPDHEWCSFGFGAVFAASIILVSARFPNIFTPSKNILECSSKFKHSKCIQYPYIHDVRTAFIPLPNFISQISRSHRVSQKLPAADIESGLKISRLALGSWLQFRGEISWNVC